MEPEQQPPQQPPQQPQQLPETIDEFEVIRTLGSGLHASGKLVRRAGNYSVIKQFFPTADLQVVQNEVTMLRNLEHPNIIRFMDVLPEARYIKRNGDQQIVRALVLEYAEGGELFDYIAMCGRFPEKIARAYFQMLIEGLQYCHSRQICHRDIKPENLLIDGEFRLKLADFGFATLLTEAPLTLRCGTEGYMAPEVRARSYDGRTADLFSSGIILFLMYAGNPPFGRAINGDAYWGALMQGRLNIFWGSHQKTKPQGFAFSNTFMDLINRMLAPHPQDRLTIQQIKNHAWYKQEAASLENIRQDFAQRKLFIQEKKKQQRSSGSRGKANDIPKHNLDIIKKNISLKFEQTGVYERRDNDITLLDQPLDFVAKLEFLLTAEDNLVLEKGIQEKYEVAPIANTNKIVVKLRHTMFIDEAECSMLAELWVEGNRMVVRFSRDEDRSMDLLTFLKLTRYLRDCFDA